MHQGGPTSAASHERYDKSEKGRARRRRYRRSPKATANRARQELRKLGAQS